MLVGSFALDPVAGARFRAVIEALVKADRIDPGQAAGQAPLSGEGEPGRPGEYGAPDRPGEPNQPALLPLRDERSASQRRADALHHLCYDAMTGQAGAAAATTQVVIAATPEQVAAAMAAASPDEPAHRSSRCRSSRCRSSRGASSGDGAPAADGVSATPDGAADGGATFSEPGLAGDVAAGPVSPGSLAALLCSAVLHGVVTDGPGGAVLYHGRSKRLSSPAQVRALIARDRGCIVPGCTQPPHRCEAHHVRWWRHGGGTDIDNPSPEHPRRR